MRLHIDGFRVDYVVRATADAIIVLLAKKKREIVRTCTISVSAVLSSSWRKVCSKICEDASVLLRRWLLE